MKTTSLALIATPVFTAAEGGASLTLLEAWTGTLAYTFQLYFDFSGYSDMAIGLAYMLGGTGGYLVGFLVASALVGFAADRLHRLALWPAMLLGLAVIYALGLGWLAQFVPADKLLAYGMTPFVAGDLVKVTLAALLVTKLPKNWAERLRGGALNG